MDFLKSIMIAASGLKAQSGRMRIVSENIANANSTSRKPGGDPYRRQIPSFKSHFDRELGAKTVEMGRILPDKSDFRTRYDPGHPAADAKGYVKLPNVNSLVETVDLQEAQRSYQANLNVISATRTMVMKTLDILKV
ncbi:flagellar basal body rod protein FlgC [Cohaesibacter gelatinilyticus]|uniref:Flagellar basal-body rod protein FlgC n=1 Tax=Cohaesibacter gelatinilyticus TaxID=372072 RepID=A0A285NH12_9HYPH|nr:flagellar basal body rod protein FlgC [Cohaesibacter gelatinilyticus]SNZ08792.1 flagellar basal-body rod protein FlgC [Cohaesibacter gelatinilyticus]HAT86752.1 flagellar basal body rod protein FlgC [Hyphomicrobiales bacterium]